MMVQRKQAERVEEMNVSYRLKIVRKYIISLILPVLPKVHLCIFDYFSQMSFNSKTTSVHVT